MTGARGQALAKPVAVGELSSPDLGWAMSRTVFAKASGLSVTGGSVSRRRRRCQRGLGTARQRRGGARRSGRCRGLSWPRRGSSLERPPVSRTRCDAHQDRHGSQYGHRLRLPGPAGGRNQSANKGPPLRTPFTSSQGEGVAGSRDPGVATLLDTGEADPGTGASQVELVPSEPNSDIYRNTKTIPHIGTTSSDVTMHSTGFALITSSAP